MRPSLRFVALAAACLPVLVLTVVASYWIRHDTQEMARSEQREEIERLRQERRAVEDVQRAQRPEEKGEEFPGPIVQKARFTVSGPYTHENLTVFLIHGEERLKGKPFLTLQEALDRGSAVVHETGNVGELAVENQSVADEVYIQSGDIVKGGQQDRVLRYDLVVSAHSGRVPLPSFCVEHGRWQGRGQENAASFGSSSSYLPGGDLKRAARYEQDQAKVWEQVAATQARLKRSLGRDIPTASDSSLQLTLEAPEVQEFVSPFTRKLAAVPVGKKDVIGFACAVNGKVTGAEVYGSAALFRKLWPKLLQATAIEALAGRTKDGKHAATAAADVRAFLADAEGGKALLLKVSDRVRLVRQETGRNLLFETRDQERDGAWVHRSYLTKDD